MSHKGHLAHTNGPSIPKPLYKVNEKVLCYEPDAKKAQVLYNSKVLEVVRKEKGGKSYYEYKIHFQGWNSSWDRYVREDNVLKDTEENRNLQDKLQEQAQLLNKNAIKKKKKKTVIEKIREAAKDANGNSINHFRGDHQQSSGTDKDTTEPESSEEEDGPKESQQLVVPEGLKKILEDDFFAVKDKKNLVVLPARFTVVELLEEYIFHVGRQELSSYIEKMEKLPKLVPSNIAGANSLPGSSLGGKSGKLSILPSSKTPNASRAGSDTANEELIKTFQRINFTKKIVEDVRIMFDFLLYQILLYKHENEQYNEFLKGDYQLRNLRTPQARFQELKHVHSTPTAIVKENKIKIEKPEGSGSEEPPRKRRKLLSTQSTGSQKNTTTTKPSNANSSIPLSPAPSGSNKMPRDPQNKCDLDKNCEFPWACEQLNRFMDELSCYQMLPPGEIDGTDVHPSLCYGIHHLLRLFVKMPEVLSKTSIPRKKMRSIVAEINNLLVYIAELKEISLEKDWFNPAVPRYEEDYIDETNCHMFARGQVRSTKNSTLRSGKKLPSESDLRKGPLAGSSNSAILRSIKTENPSSSPKSVKQAVLTDQQDFSSAVQNNIKTEGGKGPVKRSQRQRAVTKSAESIVIDGSALGVRKSLSVEELSRETLVAANNNPDSKSYSLRMHCRGVPYK